MRPQAGGHIPDGLGSWVPLWKLPDHSCALCLPLTPHKCHPGGQTLPPPTALSNVTSNTHQIHLSHYPLQNKPSASPEVCPIAPRPHSPVGGRRKESKGDSLGGGAETGDEALPGLCLGCTAIVPLQGARARAAVAFTTSLPKTHAHTGEETGSKPPPHLFPLPGPTVQSVT